MQWECVNGGDGRRRRARFFSGNVRKQNVSLCYCEITPDIKTELYV